MRGLVSVSLGIGLSIALAQPAAAQTAVSAADGAAIKTVVQKYVDAREQGNEAAVAALFTPDADQLVSSGEWRRGRDNVVKGALASSARSSGKRTITIETMRQVAPGVVIADGRYEIAGGGANGAARQMWAAFVLAHAEGAWRIAAIRNMLPAPPPPPVSAGR